MATDQYPMPPFLIVGAPWPPPEQAERLAEIRDWRELFECRHHRVFEAHYRRLQDPSVAAASDKEPRTILDVLAQLKVSRETYEQEINLPQALSLLWADLIAGEPPKFGVGPLADGDGEPGDEERAAIDRLTRDIVGEVHEAAIEQSVAGDAVFVVTWRQDRGARVTAYPADQWIPWSASGDPNDITAHVLFREVADPAGSGATVLNVEIHYPGMVRYRRYRVQGGEIAAELEPELPPGAQKDQELQGVTEFLVQHGPNIVSAKGIHGLSDYRAIETLVAELDVRASQWGRLFDRFTAPTMYGPASILEQDRETGLWVYRTSPDGRFIPLDQDDKEPGYLTWDARLDAQLEVWDRLLDMWYTVTGTTPAAFSLFREGGAPSGTALRLRLARPLQVAGRKRERLEPALRRALLAAQQLEAALGAPGGQRYRPVWPVIDWADGLPHDPREAAETESMRKREGLTSTKRALMRLDGLSEAEAEQQAVEIAEEQALERGGPFYMPGATEGLNGPGRED